MFYDKELQIQGVITEGYRDEFSIYHEPQFGTVKTVMGDVQPYSQEMAKRQYGFDINVSNRVFLDFEPLIRVGTKMKHNDITYIVKKIIDWDTFMELMIDVD
ncbi:hypothetical protein [Schinkia azotoformans]|uniref:hypothetical protein n=1 Tax=Schinkia azotoformans TaxID=1454 RepID=UPI002DBD1193|nr:hypothetical protein [Schinkia azotoformans]MEC1780073.1 hypothetical protein [Schinkia azotoformans]MED4330848.1 hypothetical protein [Schinkia azotoformans]